MMSGEIVIRKCKLCNGYFQTKHSSDQMYCSRIYKNTSATCSEVGIRKTYKKSCSSIQSIRSLQSPIINSMDTSGAAKLLMIPHWWTSWNDYTMNIRKNMKTHIRKTEKRSRKNIFQKTKNCLDKCPQS